MIRDKTPRMRGRKLQERNQRLFAHQPKCALRYPGCTLVVQQQDHKVPLFMGGLDHESNLQGVCFHCHEIKTLKERGCTPKPTEPLGLDW